MKQLFGLSFIAGLFVATSAHATTTIADFELNNSTANSAGTAATLTNNGGSLGATGITFAANNGPTVSGLPSLSAYTIDIGFFLDNLSGWRKIVDYMNLTSDAGVYNLNGSLNFFPFANSGTSDFTAGNEADLMVTRSASGTLTGYVNGTKVLSTTDTTSLFTIGSVLNFFIDDNVTAQREASSGFVDYIRIYSPSSSGVPEPATWAMMLLGFGAIGFTVRRAKKWSEVPQLA